MQQNISQTDPMFLLYPVLEQLLINAVCVLQPAFCFINVNSTGVGIITDVHFVIN